MSVLSQFFGGTGLSARNIPINFLVVGGGGGGGAASTVTPGADLAAQTPQNAIGGGGGGGAVCYGYQYNIAPKTVCPITVGAAGVGGVGIGSTTSTRGSNGGNSSFQDPTGQTFLVLGGGGGGAGSLPSDPAYTSNPLLRNGLPGGSGGASGGYGNAPFPIGITVGDCGSGAYFSSLSTTYAVNTIRNVDAYTQGVKHATGEYLGYPGVLKPQNGPSMAERYAGGSSYATINISGDPAVDITNFGENNGFISNISGIATMYGQGGYSAGYFGGFDSNAYQSTNLPPFFRSSPPAGAPNTGLGGAGCQSGGFGHPTGGSPNVWKYAAGPGRSGQAGVVFIQYPTAFAASPSFPGATDISPSTPGYRTYRFTSPGSITLP